jgi:hypothetical protein
MSIGLLWLVSLAVTVTGWASLVRAGQLLEVPGGQAIFVNLAVLAGPALATAMSRRHPGEWTGVLLGTTVLLAALAACRSASLDGFTSVAGPTALVVALLPAVVIARYPALQAPPRQTAVIAVVAWIAALLGLVVGVAALVSNSVPNPWWVSEHGAPADHWINGLLAGYTVVVVVGAAVTGALVIGRYRAGPRHARASLKPLVYPALAWTISVTATAVWTFVAGLNSPHMDVPHSNSGQTFGLLPAVLVGALAAGIGWLDLAVRQPGRTSGIARVVAPPVQVYLSRALADPSIRVAYPAGAGELRFEDVEYWVDREGRPVSLADRDRDRAIAIIERNGVVIGLVEHDAATAGRPDAVELVATGAGLVMETEWLTASANRDLENSRLLVSRLLSAADEPRESLRSKLVYGPLADLDAVAVALGDGASLADCLPALAAVSARVRAISHGVFPEQLAAGGLAEALPTATGVGRHSSVLELTAYLLARDDPHAVIVEVDGLLRIVTRQNPEESVRDRVKVLGGRIEAAGAEWTIDLPIAETLG